MDGPHKLEQVQARRDQTKYSCIDIFTYVTTVCMSCNHTNARVNLHSSTCDRMCVFPLPLKEWVGRPTDGEGCCTEQCRQTLFPTTEHGSPSSLEVLLE